MSGSARTLAMQLTQSLRIVRSQSTQHNNTCRYGPHGQTEKVLRQAMWDKATPRLDFHGKKTRMNELVNKKKSAK
eukprot:m.429189 g.429189  ORF g.429189 m.429189 type:complete len:75 (+) comp16972_c0_seq1:4384-4608(+)